MRGTHALAIISLSVSALAAAPAPGFAAEGTELASAADKGDPFDVYIGVDYAYEAKRAAIKREYAGPEDGMADGPMPIVKDLLYTQNRHIITPHLQVGLFHDLELHVALPIVVTDKRSYEFDQRLGSGCVFTGADANCVDAANSTTVRDGLLPSDASSIGYDAGDPTTNFAAGSTLVFRGVDRAGLDQVHVGLAWAPMSQERDDTKPTWVVGADFKIAIGKPMRFNRMTPSAEDSVGSGYSEFRVYTSISKRTTWAEPFVTFFWETPLPMDGDDPSDAGAGQFWNVGFGQDAVYPQQIAGANFGFNGIPWRNDRQQQYLGIEVRANAVAHFQGRGYSEMWEVFALGGDVTTNPTAPLRVDLDPTPTADLTVAHPGVTTVENYMTFGGRLGLRGQLGGMAKFNVSLAMDYDQSHRISWDDAGDELPGCSATVTTGCENDNDNVVSPDTKEVNPLFNRLINLPGRRYLVDESVTYVFFISGTLTF